MGSEDLRSEQTPTGDHPEAFIGWLEFEINDCKALLNKWSDYQQNNPRANTQSYMPYFSHRLSTLFDVYKRYAITHNAQDRYEKLHREFGGVDGIIAWGNK